MPAENIDKALAAFLIPDPTITAGTLLTAAGGSSYTLGSPQPGAPVFAPLLTGASATLGTLSPDLRVLASGSQSTDQGLVVGRAGMPGDGLDVVAMRIEASGPVFRGLSQPQTIEALAYGVLDVGIDTGHNAHGIETDDGAALFVWGNSGHVEARRYSIADHGWEGAAVDVLDDTLPADDDHARWSGHSTAAAIRLRSGRIVAITTTRALGDFVQIASAWSDDHGRTWRSGSLAAADLPILSTRAPTAIAAAYDPVSDSVLVVVTIPYEYGQDDVRPLWAQYASSDGGASFALVDWWGDPDDLWSSSEPEGRPPAIVADPRGGGFRVLWVRGNATIAEAVAQLSIGSPYLRLRDQEHEILATIATAGTGQDLVVAWGNRQGELHAWAPSPLSGGVLCLLSRDGGATWSKRAALAHAVPSGLADRLVVAPCLDRVVVAITDTSATAWAPQQLMLYEGGGWQALCQPRLGSSYPYEIASWDGVWLPYCAPTAIGCTLAGTAGTLATTGIPRLTLPVGTPSAYTRTLALSSVAGAIVHCEVSGLAGGDVTASDRIGTRLRIDAYHVEARLSATQIALYDLQAGALIGSAADLAGDRVHLRLATRADRAALYQRAWDSETWSLVAAGTMTSGSAGTDGVTFGQHGSATGSDASTWHRCAALASGGVGDVGQMTDAPGDGVALSAGWSVLPGGLLPDPSARLPLMEGLLVAGAGGPGLRGESWQIPCDDRHAADHLLSRAVAEDWRSADTSAAQRIAWQPAAGERHHPGGRAIGMAVFGANVPKITLQGDNGSGWTTIAELDLTVALDFTRDGDTVRYASGGTDRGTLDPDDLIGADLDFGSGTVRRIVGATGGTWSGSSATATLRIESDGTEPATGTAKLRYRSGAVVVLGHTSGWRKWSALIASGSATSTGDYRIGRLVVGPLAVLGSRYGRGRVEAIEVVGERIEGAGWVRGRRLALDRRRFSVAWPEGLPTRRHLEAPAYQTGGGQPLAHLGDVSALDLVRRYAGAADGQVVYLPRLDRDPTASGAETLQVLGRRLAILCRMDGPPQVENIDGDEEGAEAVRISAVELVEEP